MERSRIDTIREFAVLAKKRTQADLRPGGRSRCGPACSSTLKVMIAYATKLVAIRRIGTHAEHSRW